MSSFLNNWIRLMKRPSVKTGVAALVCLLATSAHTQNSQFRFDPSGNLQAQAGDPLAPPRILGQPQVQIVIPGESASFSVVVADTRGISYQWFFNGAPISGATKDAFLIANVSATNEGQYSVTVANVSGPLLSASASLSIDSDGDGLPDSWEIAHFGNLNQTAMGDFDRDGVSNLQEFLDGTDPTNSASALYRITLFNDGGTVMTVPDQPNYTNGQMVTLTAAGSDPFPFHAWTGDVFSQSSSITLAMTNNKTLFARFTPVTFQWTNTVSGDWNVASNWTPNSVPGSNDSVLIVSSATVTLNSNADVADFTLGYGSIAPVLTGTGVLTIRRAGAWVAGTMSGTGRTVVAPGASFTIASASIITLSARTFENGGTALWPNGGSIILNAGVITNDAGALFQLQSPASLDYGGGSPRFDNAGSFLATGTSAVIFAGPSFNNYGMVDLQSGTLRMLAGGIHAGAVVVATGATVNFARGTFTSGGDPSITGAGTFLVSGGTATLAGTVNVNGSNVFSNGSVDFTGNYTCTNNTMVISGGGIANFDGTGVISPAFLNLSGGSLGGANTVTVGSAMNWTSGSMTGNGRTVIPAGVTLNIVSGTPLSIVNRTLDNGGTALWSGGTMIINTGLITNEAGALFQIQSPGTFEYGGGSPRVDNAGVFRLTGAGTTFFAGVNFNNYNDTQIQGGTLRLNGGLNNGTMEVPAGTTIDFSGGVFTSSGNSSIAGAGTLMASGGTSTVAGTVNVSGSNVFSNGSVDFTGNYTCTNNTMVISGGGIANFDGTGVVSPAVLNLSGGSLGGANTVTVGSAMNWTSGSMTGSGRTVIPAGVTLNIVSGSPLSIINRTLDNGGTALWSGGTMVINAGVITNEAGALFQIQNPGTLAYGGGSPRVDNAGIVRLAGAGTTFLGGVNFNNYNDTQIQGGTLRLNGGLNNGTVEVPAGTTLNFSAGTFTSSGGSTIAGAGTFLVNGGSGTLAGTVNVSGSNVFSGGSIDLTGNYISTNNTLVIAGGVANFDGTGAVSPALLNLSSGSLGGSGVVTVGGAMNWTGGSMTGSGRTVIPAGVTLNMSSGSVLSIASRTLENGGTATWTGAGAIALNAAIITNRVGALFNPQNTSSMNNAGGSPRFDNAGTFRKSVSTGKLTFSGVAFNNFDTVDIQNGLLAANGGYVSSSNAVLNCALSGTTPGTTYGQLQVSGSVTVNGTLSVNLANNYIPTTSDSFTVLSAGTRNGTFASFIYPSNQVSLLLSNTTTSVIVRVTDVLVVPQPLLLPPQLSGSNVNLTWTAVSNTTYRVEFNPTLGPFNWSALLGDVTAISNAASKFDSLTPTNRFYRVRVIP